MTRLTHTRVIQTRPSIKSASQRVGKFGEVWYDPAVGAFRLSDGQTPGGTIINGGGSGPANTGSITFDGNSILGAGTGSGDGLGNSTLELVPDEDLYSNDQYLIIDPTQPGHIHVRAGGTQDQSNADLFLGGELNNVRVNDYNGVRINNTRNFESNFFFDVNFSNATWYTNEGGLHVVDFETQDQTIINYFFQVGNNPSNRLRVYYDNGQSSYALTQTGSASFIGNDLYRIEVDAAPPSSPTSLTALDFVINSVQENYIGLENNDFRVEVFDDIRMFGRDIFRLVNRANSEPIEITTDGDNIGHTWYFNSDGTLTFPDGTNQTTAYRANVLPTAYTQTVGSLTPIDLTKPVAKIDPIGNYNGYSLADGAEGQVLYIVPRSGTQNEDIGIRISNVRFSNGNGLINEYQNYDWLPFRGTPGSACLTLIFTDGHWNVPHGIFD